MSDDYVIDYRGNGRSIYDPEQKALDYNDAVEFYDNQNKTTDQVINQLSSFKFGGTDYDFETACKFADLRKKDISKHIENVEKYYETKNDGEWGVLGGLIGKVQLVASYWISDWFEPTYAGLNRELERINAVQQEVTMQRKESLKGYLKGASEDLLKVYTSSEKERIEARLDLNILIQRDSFDLARNLILNGKCIDPVNPSKIDRGLDQDKVWGDFIPYEIYQFLASNEAPPQTAGLYDQLKLIGFCMTQDFHGLLRGKLQENYPNFEYQPNYDPEYNFYEQNGSKFLEVKNSFKKTSSDTLGFLNEGFITTTQINLSDMKAPVVFKSELISSEALDKRAKTLGTNCETTGKIRQKLEQNALSGITALLQELEAAGELQPIDPSYYAAADAFINFNSKDHYWESELGDFAKKMGSYLRALDNFPVSEPTNFKELSRVKFHKRVLEIKNQVSRHVQPITINW